MGGGTAAAPPICGVIGHLLCINLEVLEIQLDKKNEAQDNIPRSMLGLLIRQLLASGLSHSDSDRCIINASPASVISQQCIEL